MADRTAIGQLSVSYAIRSIVGMLCHLISLRLTAIHHLSLNVFLCHSSPLIS